MFLKSFLPILFLIGTALGQSNYASQANSIEYIGSGLPEEATLDGKVGSNYLINYFISFQFFQCIIGHQVGWLESNYIFK